MLLVKTCRAYIKVLHYSDNTRNYLVSNETSRINDKLISKRLRWTRFVKRGGTEAVITWYSMARLVIMASGRDRSQSIVHRVV